MATGDLREDGTRIGSKSRSGKWYWDERSKSWSLKGTVDKIDALSLIALKYREK